MQKTLPFSMGSPDKTTNCQAHSPQAAGSSSFPCSHWLPGYLTGCQAISLVFSLVARLKCSTKMHVYSVNAGTYHFLTLKNVLGTHFLSKVCTRKHTFNTKYVLVHTSTHRYILEVKLMYPVHTLGKLESMNLVQTGLCLFISVPYHSMVPIHTGTYQYELGTYYCSGFQGRASRTVQVSSPPPLPCLPAAATGGACSGWRLAHG
jgi:hypothetical protein